MNQVFEWDLILFKLLFIEELMKHSILIVFGLHSSLNVSILRYGIILHGLGSLIVCETGGIGNEEHVEILADGLLSFKDDLIGYHADDTIIVRIHDDIFVHDGVSCDKTAEVAQFFDAVRTQSHDLACTIFRSQSYRKCLRILKVRFHERFAALYPIPTFD